MAIYRLDLTVPPDTDEGTPVNSRLYVAGRYIKNCSLLFPAGCYGVVSIALFDGGLQIAPALGGWLIGNDMVISWAENRRLTDAGFIELRGWSNAYDYEHAVTLFCEVV